MTAKELEKFLEWLSDMAESARQASRGDCHAELCTYFRGEHNGFRLAHEELSALINRNTPGETT